MLKDFVIDGPHQKKIVGDYRFTNESGKIIVFCHGFKGFKDWGHFNLIADEFARLGYRVLKFNFSFNGGTVEQPIDFPDLKSFAKNTYLKEVQDLDFIVNYLSNNSWEDQELKNHFTNFPATDINLVGHSRGGGVCAVVGGSNAKVNKVIAWAGVTDFLERLNDEDELKKWENDEYILVMNSRTNQFMPMNYEFVTSLLENKEALDIYAAVERKKDKVCWIHGTDDKVVLFEDAEFLKEDVPSLTLFPIQNGSHTFGGSHPYKQEVLPEQTKQAIEFTNSFLEK